MQQQRPTQRCITSFLLSMLPFVAALVACGGGTSTPGITAVTPDPLVAPASTADGTFTGNFVLTGENFSRPGVTVTTDGPLTLTGGPLIATDGTMITQPYQIGCCAPEQGQVIHLMVQTVDGSAEIADTIALASSQAR
jgi:hypothetical protein